MKRQFKKWLMSLVHTFGSRIEDYRTGEHLGRAFIIAWRGKIHVIGYEGSKPLLVEWLPEDRVRYWRCRISFTTYRENIYE